MSADTLEGKVLKGTAPPADTYAVVPDDLGEPIISPIDRDDLDDDGQPPPAAAVPTCWLAYDRQGTGQPARLQWRHRLATFEIGFQRHGVEFRDFDLGLPAMQARAMSEARDLTAVRAWSGAARELARHEQAAKVAQAEADVLTARRRSLLIHGEGPHLAEQIRDLDRRAEAEQVAAREAAELVAFSRQAVEARRRDAETAVASSYAQTAFAQSAGVGGDIEAILDELTRVAGPLLDRLATALMSKQVVSGLACHDRTVAVRQLMHRLEREIEASARCPAAAATA
jgi:hypothetical protein